MLIHLLYTIKALTWHITPPLSLEHQCLCCWKETDLIGTINHLVFTQSQKVSAPRILKCSVPCTVTVCLQLSAVKTFFFGHKNPAFAPLLSRLQLTPPLTKRTKVPSAPSLFRLNQPCSGDPPAAESAQREGSLRLQDTSTQVGHLVTGGRTWGGPSWRPCNHWP